jgi:hypothetical protein
MDNAELSQLRFLKMEIEDLEKRKKEAEERETLAAQILESHLQCTGNTGCGGGTGLDPRWLSTMIENALLRWRLAYAEIWEFIQSVDNSEMRTIMRYRYLDGMEWIQIAFAIGEHDESYPRQKTSRYLQKRSRSQWADEAT